MGKALKMAGMEVDVLDQPKMALSRGWDVIIMQRQYDEQIRRNIDLWHKEGQVVLYEIDDLLTAIPDHNPCKEIYADRGHTIDCMLREVDGIVCSTEPLARELSKWNPNVLVVENYMDLDFWRSDVERNGRPTVGWMGGPTHIRDLEEMAGVLDRMDAEITFAGQVPRWFREEWNRVEYFAFEDTPDVLANFDIGLAPIIKGKFNNCKSAIKFMEYALFETPTVASEYGPYARAIKHGDTGYLAKNGKDWIKYLKRLLKDREHRQDMGKRAKEWVVENRSIQNQYEKIADLYYEFAADLQENRKCQ